jgi:EmrB/QacA subfamily drug resistance transporter
VNGARLVPLILATSLFMENMDSTVIATSLAAIAADIGTEPIALKLALTAYLVALAIFIPISSWMADRFGAKNVFRGAMLVFTLGSVACAISGSLIEFVGARFLQGMGGAMMTPVARLVIVRETPRHELVNALAWLTIPGLIGPIVGPPFGGFLTTFFSWHWIFLINVPIGVLGLILVTRFMPESPRGEPPRIDVLGFFLAGICFAAIVFGISVITLPALPPAVGVASVILGVLVGVAYIGHSRRVANPILDLRLLRFPLFRTSVIAGTFFRLGVGAVPFLLPLMLQLGFGLSPFESGLITFSAAIGAMAAKFAAAPMFERFGFRAALTFATLFSSLGILAMAFYTPVTPIVLMVSILIIGGFAQSTFWTGSNAFTFADITHRDTGQANVISQVWGQITFALGVALGGGALEASNLLSGGELVLSDFHNAFFVVAAVCFVSAILFARLPRNAGRELSSHGIAAEAGE